MGISLALFGLAATLVFFNDQAALREVRTARATAPAGGRFVKASDVQVFVQEMGPATGAPVLFVHGTGAWSETWRESMTALAAAGFHAVAMDLPPFGFSERPRSRSYSPEDQGRRILGVLDALELRRAVLVGHSFGGGPTMEAALQAPSRIRALVLVDAALGLGSGDHAPDPPSVFVKAFLRVGPLRNAVVATFLTNPRFTRRLLGSFIANPAQATEERVRVYQRPLELEGSTRAIGDWLPVLLAPASRSASADPASYRALRVPVLVAWGESDTITPLPQGRYLASLIPGAQLTVMKDVGHIPQLEAPLPFDRQLVDFLNTLPAEP
jgi:pimeloyl-ACP methyl ester carboxylesterase